MSTIHMGNIQKPAETAEIRQQDLQTAASDAPSKDGQAPASSDPIDIVYGKRLNDLQRQEEENTRKAEELRRQSETSRRKAKSAGTLSMVLCGIGALACFAGAAAGGVSGILGPIILFGGPIAFFTFDMLSKRRHQESNAQYWDAQARKEKNKEVAKERESTLEQKKSAESIVRREKVKTGDADLIKEEEQSVRIDGVRLKKSPTSKESRSPIR